MTTRKLLTLILILPFVMNNNILAQDAETYLKELTTGKWRAKSPVNVVSMNDGERFAYIGNDRKQIIVDYYKTKCRFRRWGADRPCGGRCGFSSRQSG